MKLTNGEIFNAKPHLDTLIQKEMPISVSFELVELATEMHNKLVAIDKARTRLFEKYGEVDGHNKMKLSMQPLIQKTDEQGNSYSEVNPKWEPFSKAYKELMDIEVELDIKPVTLPSTIDVSGAVLMALSKFITVA